jgi:competence protein ComGC
MARRSRPFRESTAFRVLVVLFVIGFILLLALPAGGFVTLPSATPFNGGASLLP